MEIPLSNRVRDLISSGIITVGVNISQDGTDIWAYATKSLPRLGVKTNISMTLDEVENLFKKDILNRPLEARIAPGPPQVIGEGSNALHFKNIDEAIAYSYSNRLDQVKKVGSGIVNFLAKDSLTQADIERSPKDLFARSCTVASYLGTPKLVSKISSQRDQFHIDGISNLGEWWTHSTAPQKLALLSKSKSLGRNPEGFVNVTVDVRRKVQEMPCPFREAGTQVHKEEGTPAQETLESDSSLNESLDEERWN